MKKQISMLNLAWLLPNLVFFGRKKKWKRTGDFRFIYILSSPFSCRVQTLHGIIPILCLPYYVYLVKTKQNLFYVLYCIVYTMAMKNRTITVNQGQLIPNTIDYIRGKKLETVHWISSLPFLVQNIHLMKTCYFERVFRVPGLLVWE